MLLNAPCSSPVNAVKLTDHLGRMSLLVNDAPVRIVRRWDYQGCFRIVELREGCPSGGLWGFSILFQSEEQQSKNASIHNFYFQI